MILDKLKVPEFVQEYHEFQRMKDEFSDLNEMPITFKMRYRHLADQYRDMDYVAFKFSEIIEKRNRVIEELISQRDMYIHYYMDEDFTHKIEECIQVNNKELLSIIVEEREGV